jgi:tRNA modification GTPase
MLLTELTAHGARPADPGEFTARAYFNGKLDLAEAEGVAAVVSAMNEQELRAARQLMSGELARRLGPIMDVIAETLALVEVGIDFADEDVTFISSQELSRRLREMDEALQQLVQHSARFERLATEPTVVLVGRPNAGKSTLLNALAGHSRAVVSPIAGTTRDILSADVALLHGMIKLIDAAGLEAQSSVDIERQMQEHAQRALATADLVVLVRDVTDERPLLELPHKPDLTVLSKADLHQSSHSNVLAVSAHTGQNLDQLKARLDELCFNLQGTGSSLALNARHLGAIEDARTALTRAAAESETEVIAMELREALDALGAIVGSVTPDEVLTRVFARFCIGK